MGMALSTAKALSGSGQGANGSAVRADWQIGCSELKQRGGHLLQTGQWSDCSFLVGTEPHQMTIKAHKLILASASPVFEAMFFGGMAEGDGPIKILDVQPDAFKTLLLYIYTDSTKIRTFDRACSVFYAAKKYMLPYLEKECTWFISLNLDAQNVCRAYELAQLFDENLLMEKCLKIMEARTREIVTADSFLDIDLKTLNTLLSLDHLSIESELDLFSAVERYAKAHLKSGQFKRRSEPDFSCMCDCSIKRSRSDEGEEPSNNNTSKRTSIMSATETGADSNKVDNSIIRHEETGELVPKDAKETTYPPSLPLHPDITQTNITLGEDETTFDDDCSTVSNLSMPQNDSICTQASQEYYGNLDRSSLRGAIGKIRFLSLSAAQFAAGPARSPLLAAREAFALLMNILAAPGDEPLPMPPGFSTSRQLRNQQTIACEASDRVSEAVFRFTVLNFKTRRRSVESRPFALRDALWSLRLVPRVETDTAANEHKYFGLYLKCTAPKDTQFSFKVKADIRLLAQQPQKPDLTAEIRKVFSNATPEWGVDRFVEWHTVLSAERGLLRYNSIALEARVEADGAAPAPAAPGSAPATH